MMKTGLRMLVVGVWAIGAWMPAVVWGQSVEQSFETNGGSGFVELTFDPFDSMNGTRALSSVAVAFDGYVDMEVLAENYTALDLTAGDWYFDAGANMILAFDSRAGFEDGGPFYGLGGVYETDFTGTLSAGSGGTPFSNPTAGEVTFSATLGNDVLSLVESSELLDYFESDSPLTAKFAPFQDFVISPPEADPFGYINVAATELEFGGTLTVSYNWIPTLGRPEDCNADGNVDLQDLECACSGGVALEHILSAIDVVQGDMDGDGEVGFADFLTLSSNFGLAGDYAQGDLDCDGMVAFADFLILSGNYGLGPGEATMSVPEPRWHPCVLLSCGCILLRRWLRGDAATLRRGVARGPRSWDAMTS